MTPPGQLSAICDFIVLTAAVTRPDLHSRVFPRIVEYMEGVSIRWLIHVDDIGWRYSVAETKENFEELFSGAENIDVEFVAAGAEACFLSATRRLALRAHELLPRCASGVLWLEDDWAITRRSAYIRFSDRWRTRRTTDPWGKRVLFCEGGLRQTKLLIEAREAPGARWFASLVPRAEISFNPGIWSTSLFADVFHRGLLHLPEGAVDDPETLFADPINGRNDCRDVSVYVDPLFQDAGRRWSAGVGLEKWRKDRADLTHCRAVTYGGKPADSAIDEEQGKLMSGYFLLPDIVLKSPLKFLVKAVYEEGRMLVQMPAISFFSFEVHAAGDRKTDVYINRLHAWALASPFKKTPARVFWRFDRRTGVLSHIEVESPLGRFTAMHSRKMPLRWAWVVPIQCLIGSLAYLVSLIRVMNGMQNNRRFRTPGTAGTTPRAPAHPDHGW